MKRSPSHGGSPNGTKVAQAKVSSSTQGKTFPIVGVGASAGGLEAFTDLLAALPPETGLSIVFVQHLDPVHPSMLPELLARVTAMPVVEAKDGMQVELDRVYTIPPGACLSIISGRLVVEPRGESRGAHMPVDAFFRSLADDAAERAVGVVLSGTATDGTAGLRAIKAAGGLTFAQDEETAKYDGMPRSAVSAGVVDRCLPPREIAAELMRLVREPAATAYRAPLSDEVEVADVSDLARLFLLLRSDCGIDFTHYKPSTIRRRIRRRMLLSRVESLEDYVDILRENSEELGLLAGDLLINVTSFFREPASFAALAEVVFPRMFKAAVSDAPVRVWVPGCSTGEEAYSIAIALLEELSGRRTGVSIQIFATDLSRRAIDRARGGFYPDAISADVSPERLKRFFVKVEGGFRICKEVRDMCVFAVHDVTRDPPFSRIDFISCRNLLIYLGPELQKRVVPAFHYALRPGGALMLGSAETVGKFGNLFDLGDRRHKIYFRKAEASSGAGPYMPPGHSRERPLPEEKPASFLRNAPGPVDGAVEEELRSALEELQSANEELQSTNEELETAKEELQSMNEELTTVNEELANKNFALATVNDDLTNLMGSMNIAIVMVGLDLRVRRFTPLAGRVMNLISADIGRPLCHIKPDVFVPDLERQIQEVIDTLALRELEVTDRVGRWWQLRIRPYRTSDNRIDGAVVSLVDIDQLKKTSVSADKARLYAESVLATIRESILVLAGDMRVRSANAAFHRAFGMMPEDVMGRSIYELGGGLLDVPALRNLLEKILPERSAFEGLRLELDFPGQRRRAFLMNARQVEGMREPLVFLAMVEEAVV